MRIICVTVPPQPLELTVFTLGAWQHRCPRGALLFVPPGTTALSVGASLPCQ